MRVTLVHDYLTEMGGAERVVEVMRELFPQAPLYTSAVHRDRVSPLLSAGRVHATFLQPLARWKGAAKVLSPLLPMAFRMLDLRGADVILSSSSGFAHHVRRRPKALHVCYCHTPPRFLWQPKVYFDRQPWAARLAAPALVYLRRRDMEAARRVDAYVANSEVVAKRIRLTYGRQATVIYPPVQTALYHPTTQRSGRFLVVSRLLAYKRIDLVVEAASRVGLPLDVIGDGPERERLRASAGSTVRFLGRQPDDVVRHAMATCIALILPGSEDFGLTPVEVQASGRPPVAFASGGAMETIRDGETGFHFPAQTWDAVAAAMDRARTTELPVSVLREAAERFDTAVFVESLRAFIAAQMQHRFGRLADAMTGYRRTPALALGS